MAKQTALVTGGGRGIGYVAQRRRVRTIAV